MNKTISLITKMMMAALVVFMAAACSSDDNATQAVSVKVKVLMPEGFNNAQYAGQEVTLGKYKATTDENGVATFAGVIPDVYDIATAWEISADEYREMTGNVIQNEEHIISGSLLNQTITKEEVITLQTSIAVKQSILISKVYYDGTKDLSNKGYKAGQYIELFNNSDETVDIAGLYIGLVESNSPTPAYKLGKTPDYIYLKQVFRFPSNQEKTKVAPGASVVIANSAVNHAESGEIDLSGADFEAKDASGKTHNNDNVARMELIYTAFSSMTNMSLTQGGPCSVVLFKTDEDVASWESVYADGKSSGTKQLKTPVKYIIDGVDCLKYNNEQGVDKSTKRLYDYIDAGYQNTDQKTGYSGKVIYRKVSKTENGRTILIDTNNSSNDFGVAKGILPREYR